MEKCDLGNAIGIGGSVLFYGLGFANLINFNAVFVGVIVVILLDICLIKSCKCKRTEVEKDGK